MKRNEERQLAMTAFDALPILLRDKINYCFESLPYKYILDVYVWWQDGQPIGRIADEIDTIARTNTIAFRETQRIRDMIRKRNNASKA